MTIPDVTVDEPVRAHDRVVSPPAAACREPLVRECLHAEPIPTPETQPEADGRVVQDVLVSLSCGAAQFAPPWLPPGVVPHG